MINHFVKIKIVFLFHSHFYSQLQLTPFKEYSYRESSKLKTQKIPSVTSTLGSTCLLHSKANLLALGCTEGKYSIYF